MNLHPVLAAALITGGLSLGAAPQKAPATPPRNRTQAPPPAPDPAPLTVQAQVVRSAPCTLSLKGRTEFQTTLKSTKSEEVRSKRIIEDYDYVLPGTLAESVYPNGEVEFLFTPAEDLGKAGATARLHLEDDFPSPGWAPVAVDATRLQNAGRMTFKALGRGQGILALGGAQVNLKGRLSSLAPMTVKKALGETENRPVASTPFPLLEGDHRKVGLPTLQFQGNSLWAWANAPVAMTLRATLDYRAFKLPRGTFDGHIDLTFQLGVAAK